MTNGIKAIIMRIAAVFAALGVICLFITERGSAAFWASVFSVAISAVVIILCVVTMKKDDK